MLVELCADYGYCLAPNDQAMLLERSFASATEFVDEFLMVYGLQPVLVDRQRYRELLAVAERWLSSDGKPV